MRNLRKLTLLAMTALAAMAFAASSASAQGLTISNEATGTACPSVTTSGTDVDGGCLTHATSEGTIELRKHVFGIESHITSCNNEFAGRVAGNATGQIFEQVLTGASCSRQACKTGSEGNPWPASGSENTAGVSPQGFLTTNFCVEPVGGGTDETCEIDVPFNSYSNQHRQEYGQVGEMSSHGISGFRCELVGHWNSETGGTHDGQAEQEGVITHGGGGGGGGGSWSIDIQPDSWTFSDTTTFKDFKIKNTGTNSWKVRSGGAEVTTGFYGEDPNGCLNPSKTYNPGTECTMKVRAQQLGKTGKIQVQNDHYVTDYSPLWS